MGKPTIRHFAFQGDSLSDRGTLDKRRLFGIIPLGEISGLNSKSPMGRFTNGLVWTDYLSLHIAKQFPIQKGNEVDGGHSAITLNNDLYIHYQGQDFVRSYDEGGLTAHDYSWHPSNSVTRFFTRLIVATLELKRKLLSSYDRAHELSLKHKSETLVVEWSGANDLITVNAHPSEVEVRDAIKARVANIKAMYRNGYRHFMLLNMPDLSLTPRYQKKGGAELKQARDCSILFNRLLRQEIETLKRADTGNECSYEIFDVASVFTEAFENPASFGFNPDKKREPYVESKAFKTSENHTKDSGEHMFWDDVHPTTHMHKILAQRVHERLKGEYKLEAPQQEALDDKEVNIPRRVLLKDFKMCYKHRLQEDKNGFFGCMRRSNLPKDLTLEKILTHALYEEGHRTREVITKLGWIDSKGILKAGIPALKEVMGHVKSNHDRESSPSLARDVRTTSTTLLA